MNRYFEFNNLLAGAATLLCLLGMTMIIAISGTEHLGFMGVNFLMIAGAWRKVLKK